MTDDDLGWDPRLRRAVTGVGCGPAATVVRVAGPAPAGESAAPGPAASAAPRSGPALCVPGEESTATVSRVSTDRAGKVASGGRERAGGGEVSSDDDGMPDLEDEERAGPDAAGISEQATGLRIPGLSAVVVERKPGSATAPMVGARAAFPEVPVVFTAPRAGANRSSHFRRRREAEKGAPRAVASPAFAADCSYASQEADRLLGGMSEEEKAQALASARATLSPEALGVLGRRAERRSAGPGRDRVPGETAAARRRRERGGGGGGGGGGASLFARRRQLAPSGNAADAHPPAPVPTAPQGAPPGAGDQSGSLVAGIAANSGGGGLAQHEEDLVRWGAVRAEDLPRLRRLAQEPHLIRSEADLVAAALVADPLAAAKLQWTGALDAAAEPGEGERPRPRGERYDLQGAAVPPTAAAQPWMYQHADEPDQPGFTAEELEWLARARFPAQRAAALNALGGVWRQRRQRGRLSGGLSAPALSLCLGALADRAGATVWAAAAGALEAAVLCSREGRAWRAREAEVDTPFGLDLPAVLDAAGDGRGGNAATGGRDETGTGPALAAAARADVRGVASALSVLCASGPAAAAQALDACSCLSALSRPVCAAWGAPGGRASPLLSVALDVASRPWLVFGGGGAIVPAGDEGATAGGAGAGAGAPPAAALQAALRFCRVVVQDDHAAAALMLRSGALDYAQGVASLGSGSGVGRSAPEGVRGVQTEALRLLRACAQARTVPASPGAIARIAVPHLDAPPDEPRGGDSGSAPAAAALALLAAVAALPPPDGATAAGRAWEEEVQEAVHACAERLRGDASRLAGSSAARVGGLLYVLAAYYDARRGGGGAGGDDSEPGRMGTEAAFSLVHGALACAAALPVVEETLRGCGSDRAGAASLQLGVARVAAAVSRARPAVWREALARAAGSPAPPAAASTAGAAVRLVRGVREAAEAALAAAAGAGAGEEGAPPLASLRCAAHALACTLEVGGRGGADAAEARSLAALRLLGSLQPGDEALAERVAAGHLFAEEVVAALARGGAGAVASPRDAAAALAHAGALCIGLGRRPSLQQRNGSHRMCPGGLGGHRRGLRVARRVLTPRNAPGDVSHLPLPAAAPLAAFVVAVDRLGACERDEDRDALCALLATLTRWLAALARADSAGEAAALAVAAAAHAAAAAGAEVGSRKGLDAEHAALCEAAAAAAARCAAGGSGAGPGGEKPRPPAAAAAASLSRVLGERVSAEEVVDGVARAVVGDLEVCGPAARAAALLLQPACCPEPLAARCWCELAASRALRVLERDACAAALIGAASLAPPGVVERARRGDDPSSLALAEAWTAAAAVPVFAAMVEDGSRVAAAVVDALASLCVGPEASEWRRRQVVPAVGRANASVRAAFRACVMRLEPAGPAAEATAGWGRE